MTDGEPDPTIAATAGEFVERLNELRLWAGQPSLRRLQTLAGTTRSVGGDLVDALPASTASYVLTGKMLPRLPRLAVVESIVTACLTACGRSAEEIADRQRRWTSAWRALATRDHADQPASTGARRQLPRDIAEFVGRDDELGRLDEIIAADTGTAPVICVIEGMAGVGKTRLAVHAAHRMVGAGRCTELQLFADLRGFDPAEPPADPGTVLGRFLRLLGTPGRRIPDDINARAALYRDRLAGTRALVVLDDAASEAQIEPLLPGEPGCQVLITSRRHLGGLAGVTHLPLDVFTPDDAVTLLARVAGPDRVAAEPAQAARIATQCGYLPLAVAMAARRLHSRPAWTLGDLAGYLPAPTRQPESSPAGAVQITFDLSYQALSPIGRRVFRLLGLHPGDEVTAPSAAALADLPTPEAAEMLEALADEHMLQPTEPGRYRLHQLVRDYARDRAHHDEPEPQRRAAIAGLVRHYLTNAHRATRLIHPTESRRLVPAALLDPAGADCLTSAADAIAWAETELATLITVVEHAAESPDEIARLAVRLVVALYRPLANRGHARERIRLNELAARTAERVGDRVGQAQSLEDLGTLCGQVGRLTHAATHNENALTIWRELGERVGEQGCLVGLGITYRQLDQLDRSIACLQEALTIARDVSYHPGESSALSQLGLTYQALGQFDNAIASHSQSAATCREPHNRLGEAIALGNLGWAYQRRGQPEEATTHHCRSLTLFRQLGDRYNEAEQLWALGQAHHLLDDTARARTFWHQSISALEDLHLLDPATAETLRSEPVPATPSIIRLNT